MKFYQVLTLLALSSATGALARPLEQHNSLVKRGGPDNSKSFSGSQQKSPEKFEDSDDSSHIGGYRRDDFMKWDSQLEKWVDLNGRILHAMSRPDMKHWREGKAGLFDIERQEEYFVIPVDLLQKGNTNSELTKKKPLPFKEADPRVKALWESKEGLNKSGWMQDGKWVTNAKLINEPEDESSEEEFDPLKSGIKIGGKWRTVDQMVKEAEKRIASQRKKDVNQKLNFRTTESDNE